MPQVTQSVGYLQSRCLRRSCRVISRSAMIRSKREWKRTWFSSHPATNSTSASSVSSSQAMASSRHRCRPPGSCLHQPSSVSTALYPSAPSSRITLDLPVPDIPVSKTRSTIPSLRFVAGRSDVPSEAGSPARQYAARRRRRGVPDRLAQRCPGSCAIMEPARMRAAPRYRVLNEGGHCARSVRGSVHATGGRCLLALWCSAAGRSSRNRGGRGRPADRWAGPASAALR